MPQREYKAEAARAIDERIDQSQNRRPRPTGDADRRRRELVTHAAASQAKASLVWTHDQRVRPDGLTDAEWACVLVRDAAPGSMAQVVAVALACEVADRAEARHDPRQLEMFDESEDE